MRTKLEARHAKDCSAIENWRNKVWDTPWAYITKDYVHRDKNGNRHKNGGERWYRVRCNCIECPATILIAERDFAKSLPPGSVSPKTTEELAIAEGENVNSSSCVAAEKVLASR